MLSTPATASSQKASEHPPNRIGGSIPSQPHPIIAPHQRAHESVFGFGYHPRRFRVSSSSFFRVNRSRFSAFLSGSFNLLKLLLSNLDHPRLTSPAVSPLCIAAFCPAASPFRLCIHRAVCLLLYFKFSTDYTSSLARTLLGQVSSKCAAHAGLVVLGWYMTPSLIPKTVFSQPSSPLPIFRQVNCASLVVAKGAYLTPTSG